MKNKRTFMMVGTFFLIAVTIACDVSFTPFGPGEDELSAAEIALTSQVLLQTSIAQTVAAMGPTGGPEATEEPVTGQDNDAPPGPPTSTPLPCNKPNFQSETIPDNTEFNPGKNFTKTWTVRNDGTCSWTTDYQLVFKSGDQMGGSSSKSFTNTINPGETVTLSVDLTAPAGDGTYTGAWKIRAGDGEEFGNYWATIVVGEPEQESQDFAVTSVSFTGSDQMKVGFCPHTFNFAAAIKANGKGTVKYYWVISNGFQSAIETIKFDSAGTKTVTLSKPLSCSGTNTCSYGVQLYVESPNHQFFGTWPIAIHCL